MSNEEKSHKLKRHNTGQFVKGNKGGPGRPPRPKNSARIKKYKKEYRKNNKEKIVEGKKIYYQDEINLAHRNEHAAEYYIKNRDSILERMKSNKERISKYVNKEVLRFFISSSV